MDQNMYRVIEGMTAAEAAVHKGDEIITLAAFDNGIDGNPRFLFGFVAEQSDFSHVDSKTVEKLRMFPAANLEVTMEKAKKLIGKENSTITAIPDGVAVKVKGV